MIPNAFFDEILPEIDTLSEMKVTLAVIRKTLGWHKEEDLLSYSQFERLTGLSNYGVTAGLKPMLARGAITRRNMRNSFAYQWVGARAAPAKDASGGSGILPSAAGRSAPQREITLLSEVKSPSAAGTQKKEINERNTDSVVASQKGTATDHRDAIFDIIAAESFDLSRGLTVGVNGGRVGRIAAWLRQAEPLLAASEVERFYEWYATEHPGIHPPRDLAKFQEHWAAFRSGPRAEAGRGEKSHQPKGAHRKREEGWGLFGAGVEKRTEY
jgi:hypothetical protein